jgi:GxxExxY protein
MLKTDVTDSLTKEIIGAAIEVHRQVGPGLLESAYHGCMQLELRGREIPFRCEVAAGLEYKGHLVGPQGYRVDLLVSDCVVVELKAVEALRPVHAAQVLTYLKLLHLRVGLLINFNVPVLRQGLHRIFNNS